MIHRGLTIAALTVIVAVLAGTALAADGSLQTQFGAREHGWDCPEQTIFGYFHCTPPGKPTLGEAIGAGAASISLRVYNNDAERTYAGIEVLVRADLFGDNVPPCPQDDLAEWDLLPVGPGYYACHKFDT